MQTNIDQLFSGKIFLFENKTYKVISVKETNGKAVIKTDRQTFVRLESELTDFLFSIEFLDEKIKQDSYCPTVDLIKELTPLKAEIIRINEQSRRITDKLEDVFNDLSVNPSEETFKKAKAMVEASNAISNMQLTSYKFLALK